MALNYKKRVSTFMNEMAFHPVVHHDPYLFDKIPRNRVRSSAQNVSLKSSLISYEDPMVQVGA